MKKILFGIAAIALVVASVPLFAAFEAHVINVTARIENALKVNTEPISFGTVFPQEQIDRPLSVELSKSFIDEGRVDDVNYIIRQKPKCGITTNNGQTLVGPTASGEPKLDALDKPFIDCGKEPRPLVTGEKWGPLPLLCPYLSKKPVRSENDPSTNDGSLTAFHEIGTWSLTQKGQFIWNDVQGKLAKSQNDLIDNWIIDLKVPCFGGYCAQDWAKFVTDINPNADPTLYTQPIADEHKVFGCDLWIEVTGVSTTTTPR